MKIYAVKIGRKPGIYNTWNECKIQVDGYSGAVFKSFNNVSEAEAFIGNETEQINSSEADIVAYVDGSYDDEKKLFSYGVVILKGEEEVLLSECFDDSEPEMLQMRNVAGEISAARKAMEYCIEHGYKSIDIYHDYEGIAKWCNGEWAPTKTKTKEYKKYYENVIDKIVIRFFKVKGHSGVKYNDLADELAKNAILNAEVSKDMTTTTNVYIDRDEIKSIINECGVNLWKESFNLVDYTINGGTERLTYSVSNNTFKIDFFFKKDGSVTIKSVGNSNETSNLLIKKIESKCFKNKHENANCKFERIKDDIFDKLIDFLNQNENVYIVSDEEIETPKHRAIQYKSRFGDKVFIKRYANKTILFQGNPAYLFSQLMYIMSMQNEVTEEEINEKQREVYKSTVSVSEARNILKKRLPNAYDKLDEEIKKIMSPSISLSHSDIEVEEYSCYVFPALKGLEAYLLKLLLNKSILVDHNAPKGSGQHKNFSTIFTPPNNGDKNSKFILTSKLRTVISDDTYSDCVEDVYNYLKGSRHVYFHANQILTLSKMITDKSEADAILSDVFDLIDRISSKIL